MKTSTIQPDWMTLPYSRQVSFNSPKGDQGNANQLQPILMVRCPDLEFIQLFIPKCIFLFSRSNPQTPAILFWFYVFFEKENKLTCSLSHLPVFHHKGKASADLTVLLQVWKFIVTRQSFWSPNANKMFDQVIGGVRCMSKLFIQDGDLRRWQRTITLMFSKNPRFHLFSKHSIQIYFS